MALHRNHQGFPVPPVLKESDNLCENVIHASEPSPLFNTLKIGVFTETEVAMCDFVYYVIDRSISNSCSLLGR